MKLDEFDAPIKANERFDLGVNGVRALETAFSPRRLIDHAAASPDLIAAEIEVATTGEVNAGMPNFL